MINHQTLIDLIVLYDSFVDFQHFCLLIVILESVFQLIDILKIQNSDTNLKSLIEKTRL